MMPVAAWRRSNALVILRDESGSNLVELALSFVVLLSFVMGIIGMSTLAYAKQFVTLSARQAVRYAAVRGSTFAARPCTGTVPYSCQAMAADVNNYVQSLVPPGLAPAKTTVTTSWPGVTGSGLSCLTLNGSNSPGCVVQVTVSYAFSYGLPFLPTSVTSLHSSSTMPIVQ